MANTKGKTGQNKMADSVLIVLVSAALFTPSSPCECVCGWSLSHSLSPSPGLWLFSLISPTWFRCHIVNAPCTEAKVDFLLISTENFCHSLERAVVVVVVVVGVRFARQPRRDLWGLKVLLAAQLSVAAALPGCEVKTLSWHKYDIYKGIYM